MPTVREIEQRLFALAPRDGAMEWDNVGQLLGDPEQEISRVLVALDITEAVADEAKEQGRKGLVLTCKEKLIHYYGKLGFIDEGVSDKSTHGNVVWHQMRLTF